jgi:hypothetical protein
LIKVKQFIVDALTKAQVDETFTVDAIVGINTENFIVSGFLKRFNQEAVVFVDAKVVVPTDTTFTADAILIGSADFTISAFVGEVIEVVLDVESVIRDTNGDAGYESVTGTGED